MVESEIRVRARLNVTHLGCDFLVQLLQTCLRRRVLTMSAALQQKLQELVLWPPARHRSEWALCKSWFSFLNKFSHRV